MSRIPIGVGTADWAGADICAAVARLVAARQRLGIVRLSLKRDWIEATVRIDDDPPDLLARLRELRQEVVRAIQGPPPADAPAEDR